MNHTPRCAAFISAVENVWDQGRSAEYTLSDLNELAEGYVRDGLSTCTCGAVA